MERGGERWREERGGERREREKRRSIELAQLEGLLGLRTHRAAANYIAAVAAALAQARCRRLGLSELRAGR